MNNVGTNTAPGSAPAPVSIPISSALGGTRTRALVPPRPNLGPEPWREPSLLARPAIWATALCLFALAVALLLLLGRRRRLARSSKDLESANRGRGRSRASVDAEASTPRGQFLALGAELRETLAWAFGDACRAMTIEELAAGSRLDQRLEVEDRGSLVRFLELVDQLKFAPEGALPRPEALEQALIDWRPRVAALCERLGRPTKAHSWKKPSGREHDGRTPSAPASG